MTLVHNRCKFADKQIVRLQETPGSLFLSELILVSPISNIEASTKKLTTNNLDSVPAGQTPHTVTLVAFDDLVDVPRPGDKFLAFDNTSKERKEKKRKEKPINQ